MSLVCFLIFRAGINHQIAFGLDFHFPNTGKLMLTRVEPGNCPVAMNIDETMLNENLALKDQNSFVILFPKADPVRIQTNGFGFPRAVADEIQDFWGACF